jgi:hypothetical protein
MTRPSAINRRTALKGLTLAAGAPMLGPILDQIAAHAAGKSSAERQRFVFVVQSNGINPAHITPIGVPARKGNDPFTNADTLEISLADRELHTAIAEFAPFKKRLTLLQGLSGCAAEGGTGGHSTNHGALGCYPGSQGPIAQTIDWALGDACPGIYRNVGLGVLEKKDHTFNYLISCADAGKAAPLQCDPEQAFRGLFGSAIGGSDRSAFDQRTHLLEFIADDTRKARNALVGEDRAKLDEYLSALETLQGRQGKIDTIEPQLKKAMPKLDVQFAKPTEVNRLKAQFEIATASLISGLTNSVTIASGGGHQNYLAFPDIGIPISGHGVGHGETFDGLTTDQIFIKTRQFHCKLIAEMAKKLESIKEGDGTMLDRTLIVYLSDSGEAHHPSLRIWPVVLLGGIGKKLKAGGRYVQLPGYGTKKHRTLSNLYLTLLSAVGKPRDKFGVPDNGLKGIDQSGIIAELLA